MKLHESNFLFMELMPNAKHDRYDNAGPLIVFAGTIKTCAIIKDPEGEYCTAIFFKDGTSTAVRELPNVWEKNVIQDLHHLADLQGKKPKANTQAQHFQCQAYHANNSIQTAAPTPFETEFGGPDLATNHGQKLK